MRSESAESKSIVIALFAYGKRYGEAIAGRWERASREGSVSTRRILQTIEIKDEFAGFIEAVGREPRVEKAASPVSGGGAGSVAEDEEKLGDCWIFEDRFHPEGFPRECELCRSGDRLIVIGTDESGERNCLLR